LSPNHQNFLAKTFKNRYPVFAAVNCALILVTFFVEQSSTKESTPPKFGNKCKHLRERTGCYIFYNFTVRRRAILHFLQFYSFITFKLRSTTEQMPALVLNQTALSSVYSTSWLLQAHRIFLGNTFVSALLYIVGKFLQRRAQYF
jgi:hypothetical protein